LADIEVTEATQVTAELVEALARLIPQLSRSAPPVDDAAVHEIVASPATILLVARDGHGRIVGSMTLVVFRIPTGKRAWIEDVVVDDAARNQGVGKAMNREALRRAMALGVRSVDLTSRPDREAANHVYQQLGFKPRATNIYRYEATEDAELTDKT
jgi:ribosomal protein S18 acetylase RimI-like enzyme